MLSCSIWFSAPSFWIGGGLESRCVGRVYGAYGAVHHPQLFIRSKSAKLEFTVRGFRLPLRSMKDQRSSGTLRRV